MAEGDLTGERYWAGAFAHQAGVDRLPFFDEVAAHLPRRPGLSFLEVGCAPGHILAQFCGRFGWEAHGVDFAHEPAAIEAVLRERGVRIGAIHRADFREFRPDRRYDVVGSFGFVEHFEDADRMLDRHFELVAPGGHVVVTYPNFGRGQRWLHWALDRENLRRHNTAVMELEFLRAAGWRNRAEVLAAGFAGGACDFWYEPQARSLPERLAARAAKELLHRAGRRVPPRLANPWFSPFLLAVYRAAA